MKCRWGKCKGAIVDGACNRCGVTPPPPPKRDVERVAAVLVTLDRIAADALSLEKQLDIFPEEDKTGEEYDEGAEYLIGWVYDAARALHARAARGAS
jgi:hypothetical protein